MEGGGGRIRPPWTKRRQKSLDWIGLNNRCTTWFDSTRNARRAPTCTSFHAFFRPQISSKTSQTGNYDGQVTWLSHGKEKKMEFFSVVAGRPTEIASTCALSSVHLIVDL